MIRSVCARRATSLLVASALTLLASACGQKGPLYLPGDADSDKTTAAKPAPSSTVKSPSANSPAATE